MRSILSPPPSHNYLTRAGLMLEECAKSGDILGVKKYLPCSFYAGYTTFRFRAYMGAINI